MRVPIKILFCCIVFYSCNGKRESENTTSTSENVVDTVKIKSPIAEFSNILSTDSFYSLGFLFKNSFSIDSSICNDDKIALFKLSDIALPSEIPNDPIINVVLITHNDVVQHKQTIGSVDSMDTKIFYTDKSSCNFVLEYHSGSVGYTQYFIYLLKKRMIYQTVKIDESDKLKRNSFDFDNMEYMLESKKEPLKMEYLKSW